MAQTELDVLVDVQNTGARVVFQSFATACCFQASSTLWQLAFGLCDLNTSRVALRVCDQRKNLTCDSFLQNELSYIRTRVRKSMVFRCLTFVSGVTWSSPIVLHLSHFLRTLVAQRSGFVPPCRRVGLLLVCSAMNG